MPLAELPADTMPKVVMSWRSTHYLPKRQEFRVEGAWGMHLYTYAATVFMDGVRMEIQPGFAGFSPPGVTMQYRFRGESTHLFAHLVWPDDALPTVNVPFVFPVGPTFPEIWRQLEACVSWRESQPLRADIRAWDVLASLVAVSQPDLGTSYPVVLTQAISLIDSRLAEPLSPAEIAQGLGISRAHLARLFRTHLGRTVIQTVREKRLERARYLLETSDIPVKQVATSIGMPDLQVFNKAVRLAFGNSPRELRQPGIRFQV